MNRFISQNQTKHNSIFFELRVSGFMKKVGGRRGYIVCTNRDREGRGETSERERERERFMSDLTNSKPSEARQC